MIAHHPIYRTVKKQEQVGQNGQLNEIDIQEQSQEVLTQSIQVQLDNGFTLKQALSHLITLGVPKDRFALCQRRGPAFPAGKCDLKDTWG